MSAKRLLSVAAMLAASHVYAIPEGPEPGTPQWLAREAANYAKVLQADLEQQLSPAFQLRWNSQSLANEAAWLQRGLDDPS